MRDEDIEIEKHVAYKSIDCQLNKPTRFYGVKRDFCWKCWNQIFYIKPPSPPCSPVSSPRFRI